MFDAIAEQLMDSRVTAPPSSIHAAPLSVTEIDAHVDRDRIWATVIALRRLSDNRYDHLSEHAALNRLSAEHERETILLATIAQGLFNFKRRGYRKDDLDALFGMIPEGYDLGA